MLFTSFEFIVFLISIVLLYYLLPKKYQWKILLIGSYIFYGFASLNFIPFILTTTISAYFLTIKMENIQKKTNEYIKENKGTLSKEEKKEYKNKAGLNKKKYMLFAVLINIGILSVLKYTNFVIYNVNFIYIYFSGGSEINFVNLIVPLGISFYTFQTVSYVLDIYYNKYSAEKNIGKLALFVSYFPQIIQGPISRYNDLSQTLYEEKDFNKENFSFGLQRILWGYFKKIVVADRALIPVKLIIDNPYEYNGAYVLLGMILYAVQLYADFSGGIDITIGVSELLGIKVKENFVRPYFSKSVKEYWRRWHITMGAWFTDYIFYPLSISKPMLKLSKNARKKFGDNLGKRVPVYITTTIVWFITGIWHGASWNFIVWGLGNCFIILISQELEPFYKKFHEKFDVKEKTYFKLFQISRTIFIMCCLRAFDCYRDVPLTFAMIGSMFTTMNYGQLLKGGFLNLGIDVGDYLVLGLSVVLMVSVSLIQRSGSVRVKIKELTYSKKVFIWYGICASILIFGIYGIGYEQSQFIYNQF